MAGISFEEATGGGSTASKGISFDEAVAPATSASAPVEGKSGAAFGVYPKAGMKPNEVVSDVASNIVNTTGKSLLPTGAAFAGFSAGATVAAPYGAAATAATAPVVGPFAPVIGGAIVLGGGLGTAFAASGAAKKVQDMLEELVDPEGFEQRKLQQQRNPTSTFLTELGVGLIGTSPKTAVTAAQKLGTLSRLASTPTGQRAVSGGLQGSLEAGTELASEGEITPWKVAAATAAGAAMPGVNRLGQIPLAIGEKIGGKISSVLPGGVKSVAPDVTSNTDRGDLPPKSTETTTPEERAVLIESLKKRLAEKNATVPVVEAAFRNKETGEVQRVGKAHDEQQKIDLADTHDQGFVDERGNFLTRKEAGERVGTSGQVPVETYTVKELVSPSKTVESINKELEVLRERLDSAERTDAYGTAQQTRQEIKILEQKLKVVEQYGPTEPKYRDVTKTGPKLLEPEVGLRSADLRNAGDERFTTPEPTATETPVDTTTSSNYSEQPITRNDHKVAIGDKEYKILTTELLAEEALGRGNEGEAARHNQRAAELQQELDQLRADMPAVEFADKSRPTWEELHDHLWGAKTLGEAFDRIKSAGVGGRTTNTLIAALNKSPYIRDAQLTLNNNHIEYINSRTGKVEQAKGLYTGGKVHGVELGKGGSLRTLLHEAIHAGTHRLLNEGTSSAAIKIKDLFTKYQEMHHNDVRAALDKEVAEGRTTSQEADLAYDKYIKGEDPSRDYGFTDEHEFVSEAFTDRKFQERLASLKVGERQESGTLWGKFKEAVREGLNIGKGDKTVLDEVLDGGIDLVTRSKDFTRKDGVAPTTSASKSIKDMLREEESKPDPRDMKNEDDFYKTAVDIYEKSGDKAAIEFYEGYKQYKKTWLEPVAETEKFVGTNLRNKLAGERVTSNNKAEILDIANKDGVNLEQLTYKIDRGDKLDGAEKTIADKFRTFMDDLGKRALEAGVIRGWHEDYVARNVVSEGNVPKGALEEFMRDIFGGGEGGSGGSKTTTKYGEPRRLKTREDLLRHLDGINGWLAENGKDYRFKLKTDNLAEIYADYAHAVEKAIENKNLITNLKQVRNAAGESLIRPITKDDPLPHGWEVMDNSELAGYAVHPDLLPALRFVFDAGPGQLMEALGTVSQVTKRINVVGSFFHAKSLMEVLSSAEIPLWTPIKEAMVLPLVEKGVKKLTGRELQLSAISKAVEQYKKGGAGDNVDKWIKEGGLQLDAPEDVSRGILSSMGKFADTMIGKYGPKTRVLESSLSTVEKYTLGLFDKYTWDYLHTGGKIMVADAYLDRARYQAAKEGKPFDETAARVEISRFVNDSFGGLNWFDAATATQNEFAKRMAMAAYSPAGRRGLQIALFAPDWTISTLRAFSAALPKSLNPTKLSPVEGIKGMINPTTKADYARLYQFKTALTYLTLINVINMLVAGRPVWENKDPTRIEFPDGTSMQAMKHAMEPVHWIMDPDKTLSNKLGFIPKALMIGIAGTEYASPDAPKLVDRSALSRLKAAASGALPFQVSAAMSAPEGEGAKRALLGTMGFPVYGSTAEQRKLKAAERELQTKELAYKYREKEIAAGREKLTPEHIKQGNMLRKRREEMDKKMGK
jgi:hypothetical protein